MKPLLAQRFIEQNHDLQHRFHPRLDPAFRPVFHLPGALNIDPADFPLPVNAQVLRGDEACRFQVLLAQVWQRRKLQHARPQVAEH